MILSYGAVNCKKYDDRNFWQSLIMETKANQVVFISSQSDDYELVRLNISANFISVVQLRLNLLTPALFKSLQQSSIEMNKNFLYLIDNPPNAAALKKIIDLIRKVDTNGFIIVRSIHMIPALGANIIIVLQSSSENKTDKEKKFGEEISYSIYETCSYCDKGNDIIVQSNSWSLQRGFENRFLLKSSFKSSLFSRKIKVGIFPIAFGTMIVGRQKNGKPIWGGNVYKLLKLLAYHLNFHMEVVPVKTVGTSVNGTLTGLLGLIANRKVDFGGPMLVPTYYRYKFVDFSTPYYKTDLSIVTVKPPRGLKFFSFLQPFSFSLWICICSTVLLTAAVMWAISQVTLYEDKQQSLGNCIWQVVKILMWDTTTMKNPSGVMMLLLSCYMLMVFVIIAQYTGALTSFMTKEPFLWDPIESMEDFSRSSSLKWVGEREIAVTEVLLQDPNMAKRFVSIPHTKSLLQSMIIGLQSLLDHPEKYCYPQRKTQLVTVINSFFIDINGGHKFHIGKEPFDSVDIVNFLQKGLIYKKLYDLYLLRMNQFGLSERFVQGMIDDLEKFGRRKAIEENRLPEPERGSEIQLKHMSGAFIMYSILVGFSVITFTAEQIYFKLNRTKSKETREYFKITSQTSSFKKV